MAGDNQPLDMSVEAEQARYAQLKWSDCQNCNARRCAICGATFDPKVAEIEEHFIRLTNQLAELAVQVNRMGQLFAGFVEGMNEARGGGALT